MHQRYELEDQAQTRRCGLPIAGPRPGPQLQCHTAIPASNDLGTSSTQIYGLGQGIVVQEPSVIAIGSITQLPLAVGTAARGMIGCSPEDVWGSRPIQAGEIAIVQLDYLH
jgi:actin-like ATPase involved in cell morphogenesis